MHHSTASTARTAGTASTASVTVGLAVAGLALGLAAPALADVVRASAEVDRYEHADAMPAPIATAPPGATARVQSVETGDGKTIVTLKVSGFEPFARYGAHAHVNPCGTDPKGLDAGPHYQDVAPGPGQTLTSPEVANPRNEVWLDFATNRAGEGHAKAVVEWQFRPSEAGRSVIIHEKPTSPANGTAGKRVACLNVDF